MTAEEERIFILECFTKSMEPYRNQRIVLYGLGVNSEYLIAHQTGYRIEALMDSSREGETCWGLPVISKEQARNMADVIVIVARKRSVPIIYERIADLERNGIVITDVSGEKIHPGSDDAEIENQPYFQKSCDDLIREIEAHEVITFDIFDTLLMRKILSPQHIFEVVEKVWNDNPANRRIDFAKCRVQAEKNMNVRYGAPTFEQIYEELQNICPLEAKEAERLQKLEYETEINYVAPRETVAQALEAAWSMEKRVYLISDMYYSAKQIEDLLKKCGIRHYHGLIVSSEAKCSKWPDGELFNAAMDKFSVKPQQILHIGDNEGADIECAKACGIDTFHIWNAKKLLEESHLRKILVNVRTLEDAVIVGMYMAKALNDPFALSQKKGRLYISSKELLGYISYGPMISSYLHWLLKKYTADEADKILFLARDGYLPERMYRTIVTERKITNAPKGIYVLSSRRCLAGAAIFDEEDLKEQVKRIDLYIPAGSILQLRFGVTPKPNDERAAELLEKEQLQEYLLLYKEEILRESAAEREALLKYLHSLGIWYEKENDILFDSLTTGTSAYYYRKVTGTSAQMECITLLNVPNYSQYDDCLDRAYVGVDTSYLEQFGYTRCNYLNDSVLTSVDAQLIKIGPDGKPVFSADKRDHSFAKIKAVWDGMEGFLSDYIRLTPYSVSGHDITAILLDDLIGLCHSGDYVLEKNIMSDFFLVEQFSGKLGKISFGQ